MLRVAQIQHLHVVLLMSSCVLQRKVVRALAPLLWKDATYMDALQAFLDIVSA